MFRCTRIVPGLVHDVGLGMREKGKAYVLLNQSTAAFKQAAVLGGVRTARRWWKSVNRGQGSYLTSNFLGVLRLLETSGCSKRAVATRKKRLELLQLDEKKGNDMRPP
jgi:hypothetical protein